MRISVFGLGYVGCVTAACLAQDGHEVIGLDVSREKTELIGLGRSPVVEPGLDALLRQAVERVEAIAWEVIPQLAETLVREEIRRMKDEIEDSDS